MSQIPIRLFVYGTLKQGHGNHARFCSQAQAIEPATVWGRLYHLDAGYPALEVPPACTLAHGTEDPLRDADTQAGWRELSFVRPEGDWDLIDGELVTFADPLRDLPPIDRLEAFWPGGWSLYRRVLVAVRCDHETIPAWTYDGVGLRDRGVRAMKWPVGPTE